MDCLTLRVYRTNGTLVGSRSVPDRTIGAQAWDWNGDRRRHEVVKNGRYVLQLVGAAGGRTFRAPSARPVTAAQVATYAVTVDTVAPTVTSASSSLAAPVAQRRRGPRQRAPHDGVDRRDALGRC